MSEQPTKEQIKEFWEWCGLEYNDLYGAFIVSEGKDKAFIFRGDVDLNNLFTYAVPKLLSSGRDIDRIGKDLALALFWALWEARERDRSGKYRRRRKEE